MKRSNVANYSVTEHLGNGRQVMIRAVRPDDKDRIADVISQMSSESLYRRTFSEKRELSAVELKQVTEIDFEDVVALVAVMKEDGQDRIVGGGRYIRVGTSEEFLSAEVAFLVDDAHQGLGIGSLLFKHLFSIARASGISMLEAEVLPTNEAMLRVFARSGIPTARTVMRDSIRLVMQLSMERER